ncbi:MAG: hypothetical protein ACFFFY_10085, partial [Promethearchaeota archaeon]
LERLSKEQKTNISDEDKEKYSHDLINTSDDIVISSFAIGTPKRKKQQTELIDGLSIEDKEKVKEKILKISIPEDLERQNLILGHKLYGAVSKITDVFGENVEEIVWEEIKKLPKGVMELSNNVFRVYFNEKKGIVEAVEVLKKRSETSNGEVKKPNSTIKRELPKIPKNND